MWQYNKIEVGERIRKQRKALDLTQEEVAERISRSAKFCADVERGTCGMSINTLLSFCSVMKLSPNTVLLGDSIENGSNDLITVEHMLALCTPKQRENACKLLRLFLEK